MICQSCKQNLATVHLTEIVQKAKRETHLCEECARGKGISTGGQFSVKDFLSGLAKGKPAEPSAQAPQQLVGTGSGGEAAAAAAAAAASQIPDAGFDPCPSCKITFSEFRQSGRLGCHNDYEHFKRGLVPLLEKIHAGNKQHTGRIPQRVGERIERQRRIAQHQKELQAAVDAEDYEQAARLRDMIKELEQLVGERA